MNRKTVIPIILIFCISAYYFYQIFFKSDLNLHYSFVMQFIKGEGALPANFLYYYIVSLFTFDLNQKVSLASIFLLAFSIALKFHVIIWYLKQKGFYQTSSILLALMLLFVSPLYIPQLAIGRYYVGSFTATVWHNSTTIFLIPFAILLFTQTIKQLSHFGWGRLFLILGLILVNAAIKPSYLFIYAGALPLTLFLSRNLTKKIAIKQLLPAFLALLVILLQSFLIYQTDSVYSSAGIEIAPFKVYKSWHSFSNLELVLFFAASVITGILFPIYVFIRKGIERHDMASIFAITSFAGAILIFILFAETGLRWNHGNFYWQVVPAALILFLVSTSKVHAELTAPVKTQRCFNTYQLLFILHAIFGIIYTIRIPLSRSGFF